MTPPTWLEVAVNGPWSRAHQPLMPLSADEIVDAALACADEGASIIHFHPYDPVTGRQRDDFDLYAPVIERIRARTDLICYGTLPFAGAPDAPNPMTPEQRYGAVDRLVRAGLVEWSVVDPGSTNLCHHSDLASGKPGFVYANPESHIRYGLRLAQQHHITPSYAIYEPGFMRLGAALHRLFPGTPTPIYRLMFSQHIAFGFPPADWALDAYLKLLEVEHADAPWMVAGLGVELGPLIELAAARGGHVRVGLEDAPMGCRVDNRRLVQDARRRIEACGATLATAAEVRRRLAASAAQATQRPAC